MPRHIGSVLRVCFRAAVPLMLGLLPLTQAMAHEDEGASPAVAEAAAPGVLGIGMLVLIAIAVSVWYHLRRQAMLKPYRQATKTTGESAGPPSANP